MTTGTSGPRPFDALAAIAPGRLAGQIARRAAAVPTTTYAHAWERDDAYLTAVDLGLRDALDGLDGIDGLAGPSGPAPRWLAGLVRREVAAMAARRTDGARFDRVRLLERLGLVALDADDTYVLAMVSALGPDPAAVLRADPGLVDRALWRLFEVEGGGEISLTNVDRYDGHRWRDAFCALTADGTLPRARVLAACLDALGRDFAPYRAGWFSAMFLALEPAADESAALQDGLRRLLRSTTQPTVAFALRQLARVHRAGLLDAEATLAALPAAAAARPPGTVLAALRLARATGADSPAAVVAVAAVALGHPHADVQRAAGRLLLERDARSALLAAADGLDPGVRADLGLPAGPATPTLAAPTPAPAAPAAPAPALPVSAPLAATPAPHPTAATSPIGPPTAVVAPPPPVPVAEPVAPHALAERTAALLEDASDAAELEAVLAALVTPGSERPLAPLRTRARAVVARGRDTGAGDAWLPGQVARLVLTLLGEPVPPAAPTARAARFVVRRFGELRAAPGPLLATPDVAGGWVSPDALVARLAQAPRPRHHDLAAALLRLHPDGRDQVTADRLPPAVRFALDGVAPRRRLWGGPPRGPEAWWVAARRSRAPYAPAEEPRLRGERRPHHWQEGGRERTGTWVTYTVVAPGAPGAVGTADDLPTEAPADGGDRFTDLGDWVPALAAVWPHDAEHLLSLTAVRVLDATRSTEVGHDVPRVLDALARHPGRTGGLAAEVLAAGLSAARRDHRLHAVDAFADLVPTGRVPVGDVAAALARSADLWPANRWTESLTAVARAPGGAVAAVGLLSALLPQLSPEHRGLAGPLGLLRDETLRHGWPVEDPVLRAWLHACTGPAATGATARLLLR